MAFDDRFGGGGTVINLRIRERIAGTLFFKDCSLLLPQKVAFTI